MIRVTKTKIKQLTVLSSIEPTYGGYTKISG